MTTRSENGEISARACATLSSRADVLRLVRRRVRFSRRHVRLRLRVLRPGPLRGVAPCHPRLADPSPLLGGDGLLSRRRGLDGLHRGCHPAIRAAMGRRRGLSRVGPGRSRAHVGAVAVAGLRRLRRDVSRLGGDERRGDQRDRGTVVRQAARARDQPGPERRELRRGRRDAAAGVPDRPVRLRERKWRSPWRRWWRC